MLDKCDKCGEINEMWYIPHTLDHNQRYNVCYRCCREWHDSGYNQMYYMLYRSIDSHELADKLVLDYLGKLDG